MSRAKKRELKKTFQKDMVEFLKVQHHFLPNFIDELGKIKDPRNQSYIDYEKHLFYHFRARYDR